jgi:uncharacterized protein
MKSFAEIAFTPAVQRLQERHGSRPVYARMQAAGATSEGLGPREVEFLATADSFYLATVSETGWPYVQHRGGPRGFLKVITPTRIAFADFRGNRQYVSEGNASKDDRASIIVMDYVHRERLKLLGHLRFDGIIAGDAALVSATALPDYRARIERIGIFTVEAFDWNCPQHITQRYTMDQMAEVVQPLRQRIAQLESELHAPDQARLSAAAP